MKINALKMQILMGEQNLTIKELACRSNVSRNNFLYQVWKKLLSTGCLQIVKGTEH